MAAPEPELRQRKKVETQNEPVAIDEAQVPNFMPAEAARIQKLLHANVGAAPLKLRPYIVKVEPFLALLAWILMKTIPLYMYVFEKVEEFFQVVPADLVQALFGLTICFFGGFFPTLIAAGEAWVQSGGDDCRRSLGIIMQQLKQVKAANQLDDAKDDDGDGIADVNQISGSELAKRKGHLVLTTVNPAELQNAIVSVYQGWIGVVAVLKLEFAKTIALGAAIGEMIKKPASQFARPVLEHVMPDDYHPWIEVLINTVCKSFAISVAWTIQRVISAAHSAIRGGLLFTRGIMSWAEKNGYAEKYLKMLGGFISLNHEDTYVDEVLGWGSAALGFYTQFMFRFSLPWVFSWLLWPASIAEWYIVWTISE